MILTHSHTLSHTHTHPPLPPVPACLYAFFVQQYIVDLVGHRAVFIGGLVTFTLSMAATIFSPNIAFLNVVTAISGVGFAALTSTPNMLVTMYNSDRQVREGGSVGGRKQVWEWVSVGGSECGCEGRRECGNE